MSSSRGFKWLVASLLVCTLGLKWVLTSDGIRPNTNEREEKVAERKVTSFLTRNHFAVVGSREVVFGMQLLTAQAGLCHMNVVLSSSRGWHRDLIENLKVGAAETFVVFAGKTYADQPLWLTVPDFLWSRFLSGIGLNSQPRPVITVIAGNGCAAAKLPWRELGH